MQKKQDEINSKAADMWSYAVLLWELATREVPFSDLSPMETGMKVNFNFILFKKLKFKTNFQTR